MLKEKIGVDGEIVSCRTSDTVLVVKLGTEECKKEVMKKYKLRSEMIYIENDLSWEERRIQAKINE